MSKLRGYTLIKSRDYDGNGFWLVSQTDTEEFSPIHEDDMSFWMRSKLGMLKLAGGEDWIDGVGIRYDATYFYILQNIGEDNE